MNVFVIVDEVNKREAIMKQIKLIDQSAIINWADNYQLARMFIKDNSYNIDYIFLDWNFPPSSYARSRFGMGRQILSNMLYDGLNNKVVIISSEMVPLNKDEYPFVVGSISFADEYELRYQLMNLFFDNIEEETENRGEARVRSLKPKKENHSGYKRRLSSTPWWMK